MVEYRKLVLHRQRESKRRENLVQENRPLARLETDWGFIIAMILRWFPGLDIYDTAVVDLLHYYFDYAMYFSGLEAYFAAIGSLG